MGFSLVHRSFFHWSVEVESLTGLSRLPVDSLMNTYIYVSFHRWHFCGQPRLYFVSKAGRVILNVIVQKWKQESWCESTYFYDRKIVMTWTYLLLLGLHTQDAGWGFELKAMFFMQNWFSCLISLSILPCNNFADSNWLASFVIFLLLQWLAVLSSNC